MKLHPLRIIDDSEKTRCKHLRHRWQWIFCLFKQILHIAPQRACRILLKAMTQHGEKEVIFTFEMPINSALCHARIGCNGI